MEKRIFTVGHSTHSLAEFIDILQAHGVTAVADVRRFPGSRRYPHFNADSLRRELPMVGIEYRSFPELGGRRQPLPNSGNGGWRNLQFRGYADYMQTPGFAATLDELQPLALSRPTTLLCAEALPWRCHRSLIGDALIVRGWSVLDIFDKQTVKPHELTNFAVVKGTQIVYPEGS